MSEPRGLERLFPPGADRTLLPLYRNAFREEVEDAIAEIEKSKK